jgi:tetratricopeptide (TPR) repeat protein
MFGRMSFLLVLMMIASALNGQHETALVESARTAYEQDDFDQTIEQLQALAKKNHTFTSLMLLADAHQKKAEYEVAIATYNEAEKHNSQSAELYTNRASALIWSGNYTVAAKDLNRALNLDDKNYKTWYYLGVNEYYRLRIRQAVKALNECIALNAEYAPAWYLRGACLGEQSRIPQAIDDYSKAYDLDPSLTEALFNIAVLKFENKDYLSAQNDFTQLLESDLDKKAEIYYYRAESAYFANDKQSACSDYYEAMKRGDELAGEIYDKYCLKNTNRKELPQRKTESISL